MSPNTIRLSSADQLCDGSPSASTSFVLAALRALHLDPDRAPPPQSRSRSETQNTIPTLYGAP
jgi:hypothetical protein